MEVDPRLGNFRMLTDLCLPMDRTNSAKFSGKKTKKEKRPHVRRDVARENCGISPELDGLAVQPKRSDETEYRKKRYSKLAGRGADCELKGPQKRASEPAKTATESKLEPALCRNRHSAACRVPKRIRTPKGKFRLHIALADPFPRTQCSESALRTRLYKMQEKRTKESHRAYYNDHSSAF